MTTTTTTRQHYLTADQLHPGDIALRTDTKARWFAAFDVDVRDDGDVTVWTAMSDQARGIAPVLDFTGKATLLVERHEPTVTRTRLVMHDDGSVQVTRS